ncbi:AidA/PixA family protein [Burkholderia arboris]|uniref:AidA/PixA family protein n=1 Tax=Burkholderia arboris TaxID=488730 RepID=UPI00158E2F74
MLVVVDTERIKETYSPNPDRLAPTSVSREHLFMIGAGSRGDIGDLKFKARIGDVVSANGVCGDHAWSASCCARSCI